jgi:hypothetical protein
LRIPRDSHQTIRLRQGDGYGLGPHPHLHEHFLRDLLSFATVAQNAQDQQTAADYGGWPGADRRLIASDDAFEQFDVGAGVVLPLRQYSADFLNAAALVLEFSRFAA